MNKLLIWSLLFLFIISCRNKKADSTKIYFSAVSYLKDEVRKMDTSELVYKKIILSGNNSDTVDISKAEFKSYAKQFLDLPDIAAPNKADDYDNADDFDETLNNVLLMYTAKKPEDEVRSQTILMQPDELGNTHVKTILVNSANDSNEVSIEKI